MNDVVIIGSGIAGLTCAIYLGRAGFKPIVICGNSPGGQLTKTNLVENYPGFPEPILGVDLMMRIMDQTTKFGTEFIYDNVLAVSTNRIVTLASGKMMPASAILIATGCTHNKLSIPGEAEFANKGVSWCATCDGAFYKNKKVAVVGGGNVAVMEALFLASLASEVLLIHRRDMLKADKTEQGKVFNNRKIKCVWNSEVIKILGNNKLHSIEIHNIKDGKTYEEQIDGLFIAVGTHPTTDFVKGVIDLDGEGYIIANNTKTSVEGIYAAGDCVSGSLKQAVYAAGQGALASRVIQKQLIS